MFQRLPERSRIPLSTLRFEEVIDPELFNHMFLADVAPLSEDSLRNLEAMLDQDMNSQSNSSQSRVRFDSLGFKKPLNPEQSMTGLMSERKERSSLLS